MTRFFVVKCEDWSEFPEVLRDYERDEADSEVVEIVPEQRDSTWWERATVNRMLPYLDGKGGVE